MLGLGFIWALLGCWCILERARASATNGHVPGARKVFAETSRAGGDVAAVWPRFASFAFRVTSSCYALPMKGNVISHGTTLL